MIERLVFISTFFFFMMIGINGFLLMGNAAPDMEGGSLNIFDLTDSGLTANTIMTQAGNVKIDTNLSSGVSTSAPGTAQGIGYITYNDTGTGETKQAGFLGLEWFVVAALGAQLVGMKMAVLYPFASPIIYIMVTIAFALEAFALMYWTMQGARAIFGRFL